MRALFVAAVILGLLVERPSQAAAPAVDSHTQAATELLSTMNVEKHMADELRKLTAFYRTPLGQKTLTVTPDLFRRSAELGSTLARDHLPELEAAIRERAADLEKTTTKP